MNTRAKGRKFEKREEAVWKAAGWETELIRPEARFIGPGKSVVAYRDFFGRYDLIVTSPRIGITLLIQVSTEPPSSHKDPGPMGFSPPRRGSGHVSVDEVLKMLDWPDLSRRGTYEIYARYTRKGRGPYEATREWWKRA